MKRANFFFGDNINVTAIVGENGSGKSSLLEVLKYSKQNCIKIFFDAEDKVLKKSIGMDFYCKNKIDEIDTKDKVLLIDNSFFPKLNNELYFVLGETQRNQQFSSYSLANEDSENINLEFKTFLNIELIYLNQLKNKPFIKYVKISERVEDSIKSFESFLENVIIKSKTDSEFLVDIKYEKELEKELKKRENIDFYLEFLDKNKNIINLSIGEYSKASLDIMFLRNAKEDRVFLFDETEKSLHPLWQQKYINLLLNTLKNKKNIHLIITSHSPYILSDLPKENIIFLEKGKQVYPFDEGKQTFGANIHTLLSHGFFMKEGLMGEFAKSKIDEVIQYLNNDKKSSITNDEEAQNIINIVGEPIIKRELQRMLKNKTELESHQNVAKIQYEIEVLKKRIEELEKEKHNVSQ